MSTFKIPVVMYVDAECAEIAASDLFDELEYLCSLDNRCLAWRGTGKNDALEAENDTENEAGEST